MNLMNCTKNWLTYIENMFIVVNVTENKTKRKEAIAMIRLRKFRELQNQSSKCIVSRSDRCAIH